MNADGGGAPVLLEVTVVVPGEVTDANVSVTGVRPVLGSTGVTVMLDPDAVAPGGRVTFTFVDIASLESALLRPPLSVTVTLTMYSPAD